MDSQKTLFDVNVAAERLGGLSIATVYRLCRKKKIEHVKIGPKIFFRETDIESFLNRNTVAVTE